MVESIEKNRKLLHFFCWFIQLVGWVLIAGGAAWFIMFVCSPYNAGLADDRMMENTLNAVSHFSFDFVFVGLAAVILSQLARYVFDTEYKPGLMLRCGDKILYLFAVLGILWAWYRGAHSTLIVEDPASRCIYLQLLILPTIAKVLILVGLGQILKRIMPVIEESRTLV